MVGKHQSQSDQQEQHSDEMMQQEMMSYHKTTIWAHFAAITLGLVLATSPATFGYTDTLMIWNNVVAGILIVILGAFSISPDRGWARWANTAIGIWLLFAPYVLWSADSEGYIIDTVVGSLVIALAILVPGMPGMRMTQGPDTPPGWSYNPSSWPQRAPIIALALVAFLMSRFMAAYQLGYIDYSWDPFFGDGTIRILDSDVSRAWPVSDAGFGATAYMIEALSGFMGGRNRWRTMPWMVLMFGVLVVPLGVVSIILVILQPVMVGTWCTLCLGTALLMLLMIPLAVDEIVAMGQFMADVRRQNKPFWVNFWRGGTMQGEGKEDATDWQSPVPAIGAATVRGVNLPWNLVLSALIGFWLMAAPPALGSEGWAANSSFLVGPLIAVVAISAMAEVIRPFRYLNLLFGAWIIVAPWLLSGSTTGSTLNGLIAGVVLIGLSVPRGSVSQSYATWNQRIT